LQQSREEVYNQTQVIQENIKRIYDKRTKDDDFQLGDKVMKWDSRNEEKGKHGKFDNIWKHPFIIHAYRGNNAFFIKDRDGVDLPGGPINGRMLKHYVTQEWKFSHSSQCKYHFTFYVMCGWLLLVVESQREGPKPLISVTRFTFTTKLIRKQKVLEKRIQGNM
jgi:hypothetical protein